LSNLHHGESQLTTSGVVTMNLIATVEPRYNKPLFNEVLDITNDILCPGQSYSKIYGIELRYNEPR